MTRRLRELLNAGLSPTVASLKVHWAEHTYLYRFPLHRTITVMLLEKLEAVVDRFGVGRRA